MTEFEIAQIAGQLHNARFKIQSITYEECVEWVKKAHGCEERSKEAGFLYRCNDEFCDSVVCAKHGSEHGSEKYEEGYKEGFKDAKKEADAETLLSIRERESKILENGIESGRKLGYGEGYSKGFVDGRAAQIVSRKPMSFDEVEKCIKSNEKSFKSGYEEGYTKGIFEGQEKAKRELFVPPQTWINNSISQWPMKYDIVTCKMVPDNGMGGL
jgi:hypothetical protein